MSFKAAKRRRYPFGSIQNFSASASRKRHGTQVAREPNIGGTVKSNAAASQSNGRRGIFLSLLLLLVLVVLLLILLLSSLEQTECAQALVKMRLSNSRRNLGTWKPKAVRPPSALGFNNPKRELR